MSADDPCEQSKPEPPPTLYHYTSWAGFVGICTSGQLWLTHFDCLNDRNELGYALALFSDLMKDRNDVCADAAIDDRGGLQYACVASLTEEGDLLSQWQAYGDKGAGICVGLRSSDLRQLCSADSPAKVWLRRVVYEPAEQVRILCARIESRPEPEHDPSSECTRSCNAYQHHLSTLERTALTFKDPHWREEREWRLIHLSKEPPPRVRPDVPAAFIEFPLGKAHPGAERSSGLVPERLVLGPRRVGYSWGTNVSVQSALGRTDGKAHRAKQPTILQSRVPLR